MTTSPSAFADSGPEMSLLSGLGWLQVSFAIAGFLFGMGVTNYTFFSPVLIGLAIFIVFILGNIVVVPFYCVAHVLLGGGVRAICLAMGVGAPIAWLGLWMFNNPTRPALVPSDPETGLPIEGFADAAAGADFSAIAGEVLYVALTATISGLLVAGIRAAISVIRPSRTDPI